MAEIDRVYTHILRKVDGNWVGKIVFLIFRICVNNGVPPYKSTFKVLSDWNIRVQLEFYQSTIEAISQYYQNITWIPLGYYRSTIKVLSEYHQSTIGSTIEVVLECYWSSMRVLSEYHIEVEWKYYQSTILK